MTTTTTARRGLQRPQQRGEMMVTPDMVLKIRDPESGKLFFEVKRPSTDLVWEDHETYTSNEGRCIDYQFNKEMLTLPTIGTSLVFAVGELELLNFRMIERHYFNNKLITSYDFNFGFCIPKSVNTWESLYPVPKLDQKTIKDMIANPGKTTSDSFYFIGDKLFMHNKATYSYY
ncbi:hypothetical protein HDU76_013940 [Blyttiomyces sp. JEL0837]|nr:hypothetical protein HDU76_013940 [Blyttiomyces sp. JEL0837]